MKILVLENNPKELALIEHALGGKRNVLIPITSAEQASPFIQSGESRFLIANWDTSDLRSSRFMTRARAMNPAETIYILLTTAKIWMKGSSPAAWTILSSVLQGCGSEESWQWRNVSSHWQAVWLWQKINWIIKRYSIP
ncbi:MAG: hypothetical protein IPO22_19515 [Anaerolineales bacterium]|nr:hypothetical protein [Anaerolineales bacterium]